jgi:hypothetical protein
MNGRKPFVLGKNHKNHNILDNIDANWEEKSYIDANPYPWVAT